jgi:2-polyprenyl-3-methyl-5-hydroxy-6-metoxy-1,4-benzoquinol methylase
MIDAYYQNNFRYTAGETNEDSIRERSRIILKKLMHFNARGESLLDVGSGYGYFLDEAKRGGLTVTGIEPNSSLADISINRSVGTIYQGTLESYFRKNQKKRFDFITFIHVIEHMPHPKKILQMAGKLLSPDGILYIETPNLDSHLYRAENNDYTFLTPPDHLWVLSRKSFLNVLGKGYYIKHISTYSYPEHFMGVIKSMIKRVKNNSDRTAAPEQDQPEWQEVADKGRTFILSRIKYLLFDKGIASLLYPLLNLKYYGSILELYIKKK